MRLIICKRCDLEFESSLKGPTKYCSECKPIRRREQQKQWKQEPRIHKKIVANNKRYCQRYRQRNRERLNELSRRYYERNREERIKYLKENHERYQQWQRENREHLNVLEHNRRARIRDGGTFTSEQIIILASEQNQACYYCGSSFFIDGTLEYYFEIEHKFPVSRGGSNEITNIALACKSCNSRKRDKTEEEYALFIGVRDP